MRSWNNLSAASPRGLRPRKRGKIFTTSKFRSGKGAGYGDKPEAAPGGVPIHVDGQQHLLTATIKINGRELFALLQGLGAGTVHIESYTVRLRGGRQKPEEGQTEKNPER